ncbi:MAG: peptidoglycan-binding domain-containing protein [Patescibacteria group bacterium]|nr:peptidoglycan-binding domain-containing protein [Patescibacteria group bacterium]
MSKLPDPDYLYVPLHQIKYGLENSAILELQKNLQTLGYYDQNPNGIYDDQLADAIFSLQKYYGIVTDENEPAAGYFGPKTSTQYKDLLKNNRETIADNTSQIQSVNHNIPLQKVEEKNPVINKIILSQ